RSAEKARFLSTTVVLPPMSSQDRREVHLVVQEISGVTSESVGYGRERHIEIRSEAMGETHPSNLDETDYTDFAELSKPAQ
ncbi:MAG TPA: R3H domain-containing nucleic acid-binding protein, partial [Bdellovibrionota bacterium]|nr:R3H domain-containing nucleic acid-binding protein [Bdellovibrionota bacterium]